jgi:uncharacterized protein YegP (UPF0339 family)
MEGQPSKYESVDNEGVTMIVDDHPKIEVYKDKHSRHGRWRWRLVSADDRVMVESVEYLSESDAKCAAETLPKNHRWNRKIGLASKCGPNRWTVRVQHVGSELPVAYGTDRNASETQCQDYAIHVVQWLEKRLKIEVLT